MNKGHLNVLDWLIGPAFLALGLWVHFNRPYNAVNACDWVTGYVITGVGVILTGALLFPKRHRAKQWQFNEVTGEPQRILRRNPGVVEFSIKTTAKMLAEWYADIRRNRPVAVLILAVIVDITFVEYFIEAAPKHPPEWVLIPLLIVGGVGSLGRASVAFCQIFGGLLLLIYAQVIYRRNDFGGSPANPYIPPSPKTQQPHGPVNDEGTI